MGYNFWIKVIRIVIYFLPFIFALCFRLCEKRIFPNIQRKTCIILDILFRIGIIIVFILTIVAIQLITKKNFISNDLWVISFLPCFSYLTRRLWVQKNK